METEAAPPPANRPIWQSLLVGRNPAWTVVRILFVVLVSIILFKFVFQPIRITGTSMSPTYTDGQIRLVNLLAYRKKEPQRGDIVAVQLLGREILIIKRIIGLPGERVQVVDGYIHVNGERLLEPYAHGLITLKVEDKWERAYELRTSPQIVNVPEGQYFLIGDNRDVSEMHLEPKRKILGKVLF
jgi:signal peptidase I